MRHVPGRRLFVRYGTAIGFTAYAATIVLGVLAVARGVEAFLAVILEAPPAKVLEARHAVVERAGRLVLTQDNWSEMLRDPAFWASRKAGGNGQKNSGTGSSFWKPQAPSPHVEKSNLGVYARPPRKPVKVERDDDDGGGETFRTVCVRLCDGAFFPLSFATTREHFEQDAAKCEKSCGSTSRMYFYKNPGSEPGDMEDQEGRPYKKLATAFLYKTQYVEQCKCKAHPWEEASTDRHKIFALEAARAKGSKVADAPLQDLKEKLRQTELDALTEKKRLTQAKIGDQKRAAAEAKATKTLARISGPTKSQGKTATTASLPTTVSEPTALYQPQGAPQSVRSGIAGPTPGPTPGLVLGPTSSRVILRAGSSQSKSVRLSTPPAAKSSPAAGHR